MSSSTGKRAAGRTFAAMSPAWSAMIALRDACVRRAHRPRLQPAAGQSRSSPALGRRHPARAAPHRRRPRRRRRRRRPSRHCRLGPERALRRRRRRRRQPQCPRAPARAPHAHRPWLPASALQGKGGPAARVRRLTRRAPGCSPGHFQGCVEQAAQLQRCRINCVSMPAQGSMGCAWLVTPEVPRHAGGTTT